jgi:hypothetical protein
VSFVSRGFGGLRRTPAEFADRLPPGQYYERGFPVLTAGPRPAVALEGCRPSPTDLARVLFRVPI